MLAVVSKFNAKVNCYNNKFLLQSSVRVALMEETNEFKLENLRKEIKGKQLSGTNKSRDDMGMNIERSFEMANVIVVKTFLVARLSAVDFFSCVFWRRVLCIEFK